MNARLTNDTIASIESMARGHGAIGATAHATRLLCAELRERRLVDHAVALVTQLAREVLAERPPIPGMPNTVHAELTAAVTALDALLGDRR